jgi:hypothetical protein
MRVFVVELMMIDDDHNTIVECFLLNINMSSNNSITLTGVFTSSDVNNGIATTAIFSQSASNRGIITNQGTFAETTSNKGFASGVVVFQGAATNDGTVAEAVFLGSSRNVGTITASATFANSSVNAGVVHGAAVLVDVAHNTGTIAGGVQLGVSAVNTGTVYGSSTSHTQGNGYYAYGYYAGGVRTAPPDYATVAHQVGEFWYTYDASGLATLANGEYQDGSYSTFAFVYGIKAAQTGGGTIEHPYEHLGYFSDDATLINGSSVLYDGPFAESGVVVVSGSGVDLDADGNDDDWATDAGGVISWSMHIQYPYAHLGYFSSDEVLASGSSTLYTAQGTGASIVLSANGGGVDLDADGNDDDWSTNGSGVITWSMHISQPYAHLGYYSSDAVLVSASSVLYDAQGTGAAVVADASGGGIDLDADGNDDDWSTNGSGVITWSMHIQYPYDYFSNFSDSPTLVDGVTVFYNGRGTGAALLVNSPIAQSNVDFIGGDSVNDCYATNSSGVVSLYQGRKSIGIYYYNPSDVVEVGTVLYTHFAMGYDDSPAANLNMYINTYGIDPFIDTNNFGYITSVIFPILEGNLIGTSDTPLPEDMYSTLERYAVDTNLGTPVYCSPYILPIFLAPNDTIDAGDLNADELTPDIITTDEDGLISNISYAS